MGVSPIAIPQSLAYVLNNAGDKSNVDFQYLVQTAVRESSLNPAAKAPSSSAVGLFQFLDSTWLQVMKEEGPRLGYQKYADAISKDASGDYVITDKGMRAEVLKLREDPQIAADMAAAFTQSNGDYLKARFGRMPSPGELYIAHFLGPQGAAKLFAAGLQDPDQVAAKLFPKQAQANPQIFYADGHPRTIRQVYKALVSKHDGIVATPVPEVDPKFAAQQLAGTPPSKWSTDQVPSRFSQADMSFNSMFRTESPPAAPVPLLDAAAAPLAAAYATPTDLLAGETPQSLRAIDAAMSGPQVSETADDSSELGFAPLPAPAPLLPPDAASVPAAPLDLGAPSGVPGIPQARVLMSPGQHRPNSAFFVQLLGQQ